MPSSETPLKWWADNGPFLYEYWDLWDHFVIFERVKPLPRPWNYEGVYGRLGNKQPFISIFTARLTSVILLNLGAKRKSPDQKEIKSTCTLQTSQCINSTGSNFDIFLD